MSNPLNFSKSLQLPANIWFSFDTNPSQGNLMDWETEQFTLLKSSHGFLKPEDIRLVIELSREVGGLEKYLNSLNRGAQYPQYLKLFAVQFSDFQGSLWVQVNLIHDKKDNPVMNSKQITESVLNFMGKYANRVSIQAKDIWVSIDSVAMDTGKFSSLNEQSLIYARSRIGWRKD